MRLAQPRRRGEDIFAALRADLPATVRHYAEPEFTFDEIHERVVRRLERALKREIKIVIGEIRFNVLGTSPMIMERFQQKVWQELLLPSPKKNLTDAPASYPGAGGRQNRGRLTPGRPLGSYEIWCQWVSDPLLALGRAATNQVVPCVGLTPGLTGQPFQRERFTCCARSWALARLS